MVTIQGIRLESVTIAKETEGSHKLSSAEYALISSAGKVLAKQSIGGYNDIAIQPSPATITAMNAFVNLYVADINATLGLDAE